MFTRLRRKLRNAREKGFAEGELEATRRYRKNLDDLFSGHEKLVQEMVRAHRIDIEMLEKDYALKQVRLEKKIRKLNDLIAEWEDKIQQVREISSQSREVLARIKQAAYQERKTLASVLDDEKTIEMLQMNMESLIQKQSQLPGSRY